MGRVFAIAVVLLLAGGHTAASAQSADVIVRRAVNAAGGESALRALKTLQISGEAKHWEPDQSLVPGGPALYIGESKFTLNWDVGKDMARTAWDRALLAQGRVTYDEVLTPGYGFVTDKAGTRPMSSIRLAAQLRELHRVSPVLLLHLLDDLKSVSFEGGVRTAEGVLPAVSFKDGPSTLVVVFNKKSNLPALVRTQDDDTVRGTVNYEVHFGEWKPEAGVMMPHLFTYTLGDVGIARVHYSSVTANASLDASQFAASDEIKAKAKPPATGNIPYQWVIRRINLGFFLDSDQVFVPPGGSLRLAELAPNVQQVVGGSHNSLIVALKDGLLFVDAPINDDQSRWTIEAARSKYEKPVEYVVLTHHHNDHSGGVRAYMAEGATVLVGVPAKKYFVKLSLTEHVVPDALEKRHFSPKIEEIKDEKTISDGAISVRIVRVPNHHADGMLIVHVMPANIVWVTDLWSPGVEKTKTSSMLAFNDALKRLHITGATIAGGHGGTASQAELDNILRVRQP
jgi:glyoxylase-like metal-dependent hydrolase (beta-lactamase superfamily II)